MSTCSHPGCRDPGSRKVPEMITRAGRPFCIFRLFCAAHVPVPIERTAAVSTPLPTHAKPVGQVHVPRVWEITGRPPDDRRRAVREWNAAAAHHLQPMRA